jgi:hypothetical protein
MPEEEQAAGQPRPRQSPDWPGLTVEAVLYAALFTGAAFIRFYGLGRWPLLAGEATHALPAWRFLHAQGPGGDSAPFLFLATLLSFFAFGASDAVARLVPALLGTGLVLVPLALHRRLGSWGALAATFALAFSPTLVFYSRTLAGPMPALAGMGAVVVAAEWASQRRERRARVMGAAGLAIALTSSPWSYAFLLAGLLFFGLGWLARRRGAPWPGWDSSEATGRALLADHGAWVGLAIPVALISTALLLRPAGVQATMDLLATWLGGLVPGSAGRSWAFGLQVLLFYEVGVLALGILGLIVGLRQGSTWAGFLGLWAAVPLLFAALSGGRDAGPAAMALVPLSLLSGGAVSWLAARLRRPQWVWAGGSLAILLSIVVFWWLQLAHYATMDPRTVPASEVTLATALALATPLLLAGAVLVSWFWIGRTETTWAVAILGLGLAGCLLLRNSVSANLRHARDPREPLAVAPSSVDLKDMTAFLQDWSLRAAGDEHELSVAVDDDLEPLVTWYLRDFTALRVVSAPSADVEAGALLAVDALGEAPPAGYVGQQFRLQTDLRVPLAPRQALAWWLLRSGQSDLRADTCKLWVKP